MEQYIFLDEWNLESRFMHNRERKKPCKIRKRIFSNQSLTFIHKFFFFQSFKVGWKGVENGNGSVFDPPPICYMRCRCCCTRCQDFMVKYFVELSLLPSLNTLTNICRVPSTDLSLLMLLNYSNFQIRHFDIKVLQIILKMKL